MSVEGMWAVYFGDVDGPGVNSGIAVFETNRIFGGDSLMAYLGTFEVGGGQLKAEARVWAYNPHIEVQTAFGKPGTPQGELVRFEGKVGQDGQEITGQMWELPNEAVRLPIFLRKLADLPNP